MGDFKEKYVYHSMGSRVPQRLLILYMGDFKEKYVYTYLLQPLIFVRYIDNIFMLWTHTLEELDTFITHLNGSTECFTSKVSKTGINFLDIKIRLNEGNLETDLYMKPTN